MNFQYLAPKKGLESGDADLLQRADNLIWKGDYREAAAILESNTTDALSFGAFREAFQGDIAHFEWNSKESVYHYRRSIDLFRKAKYEEGAIYAQYRLADTHLDYLLEHGTFLEGGETWRESFDQALKNAKAIRHHFLIAFGHHYQGLFYVSAGEFGKAIKPLQKAATIREKIGDEWHLWNTQWLLAVCAAGKGNLTEALEAGEQIYDAQTRAGLKGAALRTLLGISQFSTKYNIHRMQESASGLTSVRTDTVSPFLYGVRETALKYESPFVGTRGAGQVLHS